MIKVAKQIEDLLRERSALRKGGRFAEADKIRKKIQSLGYVIVDKDSETSLSPVQTPVPKKTFLAIFGSGEIAPSSVKVHQYVFESLQKKEIKIAVVTTPAGFQPNVRIVHEEIRAFFMDHLKNFHPQVEIIYANGRDEANNPKLIFPLNFADCIFIGPGSPTYAVKNLKGTLLFQKIIERVKKGVSLSIASAASIAFSKFSLPVYEIYKAGFPLYWKQGLNLYSFFLRPLNIIPHFNNREGGLKNDTSRCYMGKERFDKLLAKLPKEEEIWGIDEHTAVLINTKTKEVTVMGRGNLRKVAF